MFFFKCVYCCFLPLYFFWICVIWLFSCSTLWRKTFIFDTSVEVCRRHWLAGCWRNFDIWNFHHLDLTAWDKLRANKMRCHRIPCIEHWAAFIYKKRPEIVRWNLPVPLIGTGYGHFGYLEISWSKGDGGWTTGVFVEPPRWKNCFLCFLSRKTPIWKINKFAPFKEHTFHQCSICLSPWNNMYIYFAPLKRTKIRQKKPVSKFNFFPMNTTSFFRHYQGHSVTPFTP